MGLPSWQKRGILALFEQPDEAISGGMAFLFVKIEALPLFFKTNAFFSETHSGTGGNHVCRIG